MHSVYIRPLKEDDAKVSYQWRNDPQVWTFTGSKPDKEITYEIESEWISKVLKDTSSKRFAIIVDGNYVGNVQLTSISETSAEFHIFIGNKEYWGKGVAYLATFQILTYAKEELGLSNINLSVREDNIGAVKSYLKNGFKKNSNNAGWISMSISLIDLPKPTISIFCTVYNHGKFLSEALDGFLNQNVNFSTVIVVGEDCSTDNSREIILDYASKYPGKFKLLLHDKNIGANKNQIAVLNNCEGKYIALCEGDDYWTDSLKLQKQVDFLEANEDYSICFHAVDIKYQNNIVPFLRDSNKHTKETSDIYDLLKGNFIHTPSVIFRNNNDYPEWLDSAYPGDWPLHVINATYGKVKFLPDAMAAYRVHFGGVHSTTGGQIEKGFATFENIIKELEKRGLTTEVEFAKKEYKKSFARFYGFNRSPNVNFNRFKKTSLILNSGSTKLKLFFWLPLLLNNSSNNFLTMMSKKINK